MLQMTPQGAAYGTYEQFRQAGWTDAQLIAEGHAFDSEPAPVAPAQDAPQLVMRQRKGRKPATHVDTGPVVPEELREPLPARMNGGTTGQLAPDAMRHSVATMEQMARAADLRRAGLNYKGIAKMMGVSVTRAHQLVAQAVTERMVTASDAVIAYELEQLEILRARAMQIMEERAPMVQSGAVVTDTVDDPATGLPAIDPRTGKELRVKLTDSGPALAAMAQLTRISEQIRKLKGLDQPKRVETTAKADPAASPVTDMTADQFQRALREGLRQLRSPVATVTDAVIVSERAA